MHPPSVADAIKASKNLRMATSHNVKVATEHR